MYQGNRVLEIQDYLLVIMMSVIDQSELRENFKGVQPVSGYEILDLDKLD